MINKDCEQHCYEYQELVTENAVLQVALKEAEELCAELRSELDYLENVRKQQEEILEKNHIEYDILD